MILTCFSRVKAAAVSGGAAPAWVESYGMPAPLRLRVIATLLLVPASAVLSAAQPAGARLERAKSLIAEQKYVRAEETLAEWIAEGGPVPAEAYRQLALSQAKQGRTDAALETLDKLLRLSPGYPPALYLSAFLHFTAGRYEQALDLAERYTEAKPQSGAALKISGLSRYMLGDKAGAERDLRLAVERLPRDFEAVYYLGRLYFSRSLASAAEGAFRKAIEIQPRSVKAHNHLGQALEGLARFEEAKRAYRKAIALEQQGPERSEWPYYNLGALLLTEGKTAEAVELLRKALERNPSSVQTQVKLATALSAAQQFGEAEALLRKAIQAHPDDSDAHYQLGRLLLKKGDRAEARKHLTQFERLRGK